MYPLRGEPRSRAQRQCNMPVRIGGAFSALSGIKDCARVSCGCDLKDMVEVLFLESC